MKDTTNNNKPTDLDLYLKKTEDLKKESNNNPYEGLATGVGVFQGSTNIKPEGYTESGLLNRSYMENVYASADNDYIRAKEQGFGLELGNAIFKTLGQFTGDLVGFAGAIADAPQYIYEQLAGIESEFGNSLMDLGTSINEGSSELFPVYKLNPSGTIKDQFNGEFDSAYWADIIPTAVATVADTVGSLGLMTALRFAGRAGRGVSRSLIAKQLKAVRAANKAGRASEASRQIENVLTRTLANERFANGRTALTSAYIGRHFEGALEAAQVQDQAMEKLYDMDYAELLESEGAKRFEKENNRKPNSKEELMNFIAYQSANKAYTINMANMFFDLYQLNAIPKIKNIRGTKRGSMKAKSGGNELKYRTKEAELLGKKLNKRQKLFYGSTPYMRTVLDAGSEAIEEAVNFIGTKEGEYLFGQLTEEDYTKTRAERLEEYINDDHFWESAFMGAIGSAIMTPLLGRKNYKSATESRLAELEARKIAFQKYNQAIGNIDKSDDLNEEQKTSLKNISTRKFAGELAKHAAANGDAKSLVDWLKSADYKNSLTEDGGLTPEQADRDINLMVNTINHVANIFENAKSFNFLPNRKKRRSARIQNNIINQKLNEEIGVFNMTEARKEVKEKIEKYKKLKPQLFEDLDEYGYAQVIEKAAQEVITEYGAQVSMLNDRKNKLLGSKDRASLTKEDNEKLLEDVEMIEGLISDYEDFIKKIDKEYADKSSIFIGMLDGDEKRKDPKALKDRNLIELLKEEIQYGGKAALHQERSENEKRQEEKAEKKEKKKNKEKKKADKAVIRQIEETNNLDELNKAFSGNTRKSVVAAYNKRKKELEALEKAKNNNTPIKKKTKPGQPSNETKYNEHFKNIEGSTFKLYEEFLAGLNNFQKITFSKPNGVGLQKEIEAYQKFLEENKQNQVLNTGGQETTPEEKPQQISTPQPRQPEEGIDKTITLTKKQQETINKIKTESDKVAPIVITFEDPDAPERVPIGFRLAKEGEEYNGYINKDDIYYAEQGNYDLLLDRTTNYIDRGKFSRPEKFPAKYKQAGKVGTAVDEMAREIFDLMTEHYYTDNLPENELSAKIEKVKEKYTAFKSKENQKLLFGKEENLSKKKRSKIVNQLVSVVLDWHKENVYDKGLYLVPGETQVMLSEQYGGTTDIMLVDTEGNVQIADMKTFRVTGERAFNFTNDDFGRSKVEKYSDQLTAYRKALEELDITVTQTSIFGIGINYEDLDSNEETNQLENEDDLVSKGLIPFGTPSLIGKPPSKTNLKSSLVLEGSTYSNIITYDGSETTYTPPDDNGSDKKEDNDISSLFGGAIKINQRFKYRPSGDTMANAKEASRRMDEIDRFVQRIDEIENDPNQKVEAKDIELVVKQDYNGFPVIYFNYRIDNKTKINIGGIGDYEDGKPHDKISAILIQKSKEGKEALNKFAEKLKIAIAENGFVFSTVKNQKNKETNYANSFTKIFSKVGVEGPLAIDLFKKMSFMDVLSLSLYNDNPKTKKNIDYTPNVMNGAQVLFSVGKFSDTNFSSLRLSDDGRIAVLEYYKNEINAISEDTNLTIEEKVKELNRVTKHEIYGPRIKTDPVTGEKYPLPQIAFSIRKTNNNKKIEVFIPESANSKQSKKLLLNYKGNKKKIFDAINDLNTKDKNSLQPIIIKEVFGASGKAQDLNDKLVEIYFNGSLANTDQLYPEIYINFSTVIDENAEGQDSEIKPKDNESNPIAELTIEDNTKEETNKKKDFSTNAFKTLNKPVDTSTSNKSADKKEVETTTVEETVVEDSTTEEDSDYISSGKEEEEDVSKKNPNNNKTNIEGFGNNDDLDFDFKLEDADLLNYELENVDAFIAWAKENLPDVEIRQLEEIISRTGVRAFGMFSNGVISLSKNAPIGTGYHEAFHFVANSLLTDSEWNKVLSDAKKAFPAPNASDIAQLKEVYPQASDEFLNNKYYEEKLADDFQMYKVSSAKKAPTTLIGKLFKKILEFIKLWTKKPYNRRIQKLYKNINNGRFKNRKVLRAYKSQDLKRNEFFDTYREQNKFTDSLTNVLYNNKNKFTKKTFDGISAQVNKFTNEEHFIRKATLKPTSKNTGKLILFYMLAKKGDKFSNLLNNEEYFNGLFDELTLKLNLYYQIKFEKTVLSENETGEDIDPGEEHLEKQFDDGSLLKEKSNKSMSRNLKRVLRSANHITSNKILLKGKYVYISDVIRDIETNESKDYGLNYETLGQEIDKITEEVLGVKSNIEFMVVNKFLERNLANINTMKAMDEKMYALAKIHPEIASALFSIKKNNQENTWFEHYKKNAYSMISVKDSKTHQDATFFADKEVGYLQYVSEANQLLFNMFEYYKKEAKSILKKGLNEKNVTEFLAQFFNYNDTVSTKNLFLTAMGAEGVNGVSIAKKQSIISHGESIIKGIAAAKNKNKLSPLESHFRAISEQTKDYQLQTSSNFNSGGKPFYGLTRSNTFSEKTDLINDLNSDIESVRTNASNELTEMFRDPQLQLSNWIDRVFSYSIGTVQPKSNFRGIKHGIFHQFGDKEYGEMSSNDFRKANFMLFLSENFKRSDLKASDKNSFYPQLLPTQSDSETPYYATVPRFTGREMKIAVQRMILQELLRIQHVAEGLTNGSIKYYDLPKNSVSIKIGEDNKPYIDVDNSQIFKFNNIDIDIPLILRSKETGELELNFKLKNYSTTGEGTVILNAKEDITIENLAQQVMDEKRKFAEENYDSYEFKIAGKKDEMKKRYGDFLINYMINSNEFQNLYTGKEYEFKNSEDKSKRGKNFTSSGLGSNPTNPFYIKDKDGNYQRMDTFVLNNKKYDAKTYTKYLTLSDINGKFTKKVAQDIYDVALKDFNEEIAATMIKSFGYGAKNGKVFKIDGGYDKGDAGSYGTWFRYEKLMRDRGKANPGSKLDKIFKKLHAKEDLTQEEQIEFYQGQVAVEKPFYGDRRLGTSGLMESTMLKFGIMYMLPQTIRGTKLEILADFMERRGFGEAHFESAKKINRKKAFDLTTLDKMNPEDVKNYDIDKDYENQKFEAKYKEENDDDPFADVIDNRHYRIQLENPDHIVDTDNLLGTQIAKLIMSNLFLDNAIYDLESEKVTGQELIDYYAVNYSSIVSAELESLLKEFGAKISKNEDGTEYVEIINLNKFRKILAKEMEDKEDLPDYVREFIDLKENGDFAVPMNFSPTRLEFQSVILSMFTKRVSKIRMPGFSAAQVSNVFFDKISDDVKNGIDWISSKKDKVLKSELLHKDEDESSRVVSAEILVKRTASWMQGKTIDEIVKTKGGRESLEAIGYRVPTEAKSSMVRVKIVGFLPDYSKAMVVVPHDLVPKMGSDFDIDKLFFMNKKFIEKDGKIIKQTLSNSNNLEELNDARKNNLYNVFDAVLKNSAHYSELMYPQGFGDYEESARKIKKVRNIDKQKMLHNDFETQVEFRQRNMDGKRTLGIAANSNPAIPLFQISRAKIPSLKVIDKNGNQKEINTIGGMNTKGNDFNDVSGSKFVTINSGQGVGASADAAKDPTGSFMGLNPNNFGLFQFMVTMNIDIETASAISSSEVFRAYNQYKEEKFNDLDVVFAERMQNILKGKSEAKIRGEIKKKMENEPRVLNSPALLDPRFYGKTTEQLKALDDDQKVDWAVTQIVLFEILEDYIIPGSNDLVQFTQLTKPEGFGAGPEVFKTIDKLADLHKYRSEEHFISDENNNAVVDAFLPNTRTNTTNMMPRDYNNLNFNDKEIFTYYVDSIMDQVTKQDC